MEDVAVVPLPTAVASAPPPRGDAAPDAPDAFVARRSEAEAQELVLALIAAHADSLLRVARRHSLCADDAQDAYQRGLEILMRHARRLDADRAPGWLHTVVRREALAINRARRRIVGGEDVDFDRMEIRTAPSPEDRVLAFEQVERSAEALQRLKPQEVRALWLKAMGNSYQEICEATGWTYTKVNRCIAEGRKSFLARYAGIEAGDECRRWAPVLSAMVDGEASAEDVASLRPHLRNCRACRLTVRELRGSNAPLQALFPFAGLALLGDADGPLRRLAALAARLWHGAWGDLGDRVAALTMRGQAVAEAVVPGRIAAVAASTAALAGGGLAVSEVHVGAHPGAASHAAAPAVAAPSTPRASAPTFVSSLAASAAPSAGSGRASKPRRTRARRTRARARRSRPPATAVPAPRPASTGTTTSPTRTTTATGSGGTSSIASGAARRGTATATGASAGGGGEFSFERRGR